MLDTVWIIRHEISLTLNLICSKGINLNTFKLFVASSVTIFLFLQIWIDSYHYECIIIIFPLIFLLFISHSFIELKIQERHCFKNCYFVSNSFFDRMLSSNFLVIVFYFLASVLMTVSSLYGVIDYSRNIWIYLLFHIALATSIYTYLFYKFKNTIKPTYRALFAREWTINIMSPIIIASYVYFAINDFEPTYLKDTLEQTWITASKSISSHCEIINYFLKLQKEIDSIFWWIVTKGTENIENRTLNIGIWVSFILINSFAILGVNRFIAQVIHVLNKLFTNK